MTTGFHRRPINRAWLNSNRSPRQLNLNRKAMLPLAHRRLVHLRQRLCSVCRQRFRTPHQTGIARGLRNSQWLMPRRVSQRLKAMIAPVSGSIA